MIISTKQFLKTLWRCFGDGIETKFRWFLSDEKLILETPLLNSVPVANLNYQFKFLTRSFALCYLMDAGTTTWPR